MNDPSCALDYSAEATTEVFVTSNEDEDESDQPSSTLEERIVIRYPPDEK